MKRFIKKIDNFKNIYSNDLIKNKINRKLNVACGNGTAGIFHKS